MLTIAEACLLISCWVNIFLTFSLKHMKTGKAKAVSLSVYKYVTDCLSCSIRIKLWGNFGFFWKEMNMLLSI